MIMKIHITYINVNSKEYTTKDNEYHTDDCEYNKNMKTIVYWTTGWKLLLSPFIC